MAASAVLTVEDLLHRDGIGPRLHFRDGGMTAVAAQPIRVSLMGEDDFQPRQVGVEQHVEEQRRLARHPRVDRGQRIEQAIAYRRVPVGVPHRVLWQCPCESLVALVAWHTFLALTRESIAEECQRYDHAQRGQRISGYLGWYSYRGYPPLQPVIPDSQYYSHIMPGELDFSVQPKRKEVACSTVFQ